VVEWAAGIVGGNSNGAGHEEDVVARAAPEDTTD
jgi:hypothetical protein